MSDAEPSGNATQIAAEIRRLPGRVARSELSPLNGLTMAGRWLLDADKAGLLDDPRFADLRQQLRMAADGQLDSQLGLTPTVCATSTGPLSLPCHAFVRVAHELLHGEGVKLGTLTDDEQRYLDEGCSIVADWIEHSGRPPLPRRAALARDQYEWAAEDVVEGEKMTDREAYDWLKDRLGRLFGDDDTRRRLPAFASWSRNLRTWRNLHAQQKHRSRTGREEGSRSIVHRRDLD